MPAPGRKELDGEFKASLSCAYPIFGGWEQKVQNNAEAGAPPQVLESEPGPPENIGYLSYLHAAPRHPHTVSSGGQGKKMSAALQWKPQLTGLAESNLAQNQGMQNPEFH